MNDKKARCYQIIDNQIHEEELELDSETESMGSNELKEQELWFMIEDVPIPFSCSTLMLPVDFQATKNKDRVANRGK